MGLAGPKKRTRIAQDPNNTTWTSATSRYGHRLLTSAGWTPGTTLGAKNAAHSAHYTAGSESHIRIAPCVEGKGLGARKTTDDTFGLRVLSGLLGRLNGKDTTEIEASLDRQRGEGYVAQRGWGMHFVFAGYLVGDKIEKTPQDMSMVMQQQIKSKKRKHVVEEVEEQSEKDRQRAAKKARKAAKRNAKVVADQNASNEDGESNEKSEQTKAQRKEAKIQRRAARQLRREQKELRNTEKAGLVTSSKLDVQTSVRMTSQTASNTPDSGISTPIFSGGRGRHAMRQKYIDQKRMACMDDKALNEVSATERHRNCAKIGADIHDQVVRLSSSDNS